MYWVKLHEYFESALSRDCNYQNKQIEGMGDRSNANGGLVNRIPAGSANVQNIANARLYFAEVRKCFDYSKSCEI